MALCSLEPVAAGAIANALYRFCTVDLRKEGAERILPSNSVAMILKKLEPFAVVDFRAAPNLLFKELDRYFEQTLATEPPIEVINRELNSPTEGTLKLF